MKTEYDLLVQISENTDDVYLCNILKIIIASEMEDQHDFPISRIKKTHKILTTCQII